MISEIPTPEDYFQSGKELLDFAWDVIANLLTGIDEAEYYGVEPKDITDKYWNAAKRSLTTSLSITQQGIEFVLKGKIAAISPYLLIADPPSKWPSQTNAADTKFSDLRSIDAQDLIRVLETFSNNALSPDFKQQFNDLREKRNKIMHSIDKDLTVNVTEVLETLLFMHSELFPTEPWTQVRMKFISDAPHSSLDFEDFTRNRICWETYLAVNLLKPAKVLAFFGIDKKQRRYLCPVCKYEANSDIDFEYKLAVLQPKVANCTDLYCPVCNSKHEIIREDCTATNCQGNVIGHDGECLTCGA